MASKTPRASYPVVGLTKAVEDAGKLWKAGQHAPITIESAVKTLGFGAVSGPARSRLAAIKHYGLIEEAGKELIKMSALGKTIAVEANPEKRQESIQQAAKTPKLFTELFKDYLNASDGVVRGFLITSKNYTEDAAKVAIKSFRDTVSFAKLLDTPLNPDSDDDTIDGAEDGNGGAEDGKKPSLKKNRPASEAEYVDEVSFKLSPNSKVEIVFTSDKPTTQEDFDLMMKILDIQKMAFPKAADLKAAWSFEGIFEPKVKVEPTTASSDLTDEPGE